MEKTKKKRNDPCWCGSNQKYKNCHLEEDQRSKNPKKYIARSEEFIQGMKEASILTASCLQILKEQVQAGVTTAELDSIAHQYILDNKGIPASLNYEGFPKSICTSINSVICHGIPDQQVLKEGDIISLDVACKLNGYFGDSCKTFPVGKCADNAKKLIAVTEECLKLGIAAVQPYHSTSEIGLAIEKHAHKNGFSVVERFIGHGIGRNFHESPQILHYYRKDFGTTILPGMFFTIEPMINEGGKDLKVLKDRWTAVTLDGKLSAQFEHTLMVGIDGEVKVLT
jgi:methionyl aminopeptidase